MLISTTMLVSIAIIAFTLGIFFADWIYTKNYAKELKKLNHTSKAMIEQLTELIETETKTIEEIHRYNLRIK